LSLQDYTGEEKVDVILEILANNNLATDIDLVAEKGRKMVGLHHSFYIPNKHCN
jgi:hypothetical protein